MSESCITKQTIVSGPDGRVYDGGPSQDELTPDQRGESIVCMQMVCSSSTMWSSTWALNRFGFVVDWCKETELTVKGRELLYFLFDAGNPELSRHRKFHFSIWPKWQEANVRVLLWCCRVRLADGGSLVFIGTRSDQHRQNSSTHLSNRNRQAQHLQGFWLAAVRWQNRWGGRDKVSRGSRYAFVSLVSFSSPNKSSIMKTWRGRRCPVHPQTSCAYRRLTQVHARTHTHKQVTHTDNVVVEVQ